MQNILRYQKHAECIMGRHEECFIAASTGKPEPEVDRLVLVCNCECHKEKES